MDREQFWKFVEASRPIPWECSSHAKSLIERLVLLEAVEIVSFARHFVSVMWQLDRPHVWVIASMLAVLLSDDEFAHFRGWAILGGQVIVEDLVRGTDEVERHFPADVKPWCEAAIVIAGTAYELKTGRSEIPLVTLPQPILEPPMNDDQVRERYPTLWKRFVQGGG